MGKADKLSRRPDWQEGVEKDNEDQKLIKPEWIRVAKTIIEEENLKKRIKKAQEGNKKVVKAVEELKRAGIKMLKDEEWKIEDRIVIKEGRIYMPERELKGEIIQLHHDTPVEGHGGRWKTTELVTRNNERGRKICGWMQCMPKIQELKQHTSGKADAQCNPRKTMEPYLSRLHHQTAINPGIQCYPSSM